MDRTEIRLRIVEALLAKWVPAPISEADFRTALSVVEGVVLDPKTVGDGLPDEATDAMVDAASDAVRDFRDPRVPMHVVMRAVWQAMLAEARKP